MINRLIVLSIIVFSVLQANAQYEDQFEQALVDAKNALPSMVVNSKETWISRPNATREQLIQFMYMRNAHYEELGLTQKDVDDFINNTQPDGSTIQEYECTSCINGNEIYINRQAEPGQVHLVGMKRMLYANGDYFIESIPTVQSWKITDINRDPSYTTNVEFFEFESFTPIQMLYFAGDLIDRGAKIDQVSTLPDDRGYQVTLKDDLLGDVARFEIDPKMGMLATRSIYLTQRGKTCVQIECNHFKEIIPGFFFPENICIILRLGHSGKLPSEWLKPTCGTGKLIKVTITGITGGTFAENYVDITIPKDSRVGDYRKSVVERAKRGEMPDGFKLIDPSKNIRRPSNNPAKIIGITTQEYELTDK
jgi:hypothetical protein